MTYYYLDEHYDVLRGLRIPRSWVNRTPGKFDRFIHQLCPQRCSHCSRYYLYVRLATILQQTLNPKTDIDKWGRRPMLIM